MSLLLCMWSVVGFLVLVPVSQSGQWLNHIYVDPVNGKNTTDCLVPNNSSQPCKNLSYALQYRNNSTQYLLSHGQHYLDHTAFVKPITSNDIALSGTGNTPSDTVIECFGPNSGLTFIGASKIYLENVTFSKCAASQKSTSQNVTDHIIFTMCTIDVGLYFYLCQNVTLLRIAVINSPNATGVVMFNTIGTNTIIDSTFANNYISHEASTGLYPGGGGIYIEFTYCIPGDNNCTDNSSSVSANSNSTYKFSNCNFTHNWGHSPVDAFTSSYILPQRTHHIAFAQGGGMSIFFKGNASNNSFLISHCSFDHNRAMWGGGLQINFQDDTAGNKIVVENSSFRDNHCFLRPGTSGGGVNIVHFVIKRAFKGKQRNQVTLNTCNISNNNASAGGGLAVYATKQDTTKKQQATVVINCSHFEGNIAHVGAAVYVSRYILIIPGKMLQVHVSHTFFIANSVSKPHNSQPYERGIGAVYTNRVAIQFHNNVTFQGNHGTALSAVGTHLDFKNCTANFSFNSGYQGGAIVLLGVAWLLIDDSTSMVFINNSAVTRGGAISNRYIEREEFKIYPSCFIHHSKLHLDPRDWNATFSFTNNTAGMYGNSIYTTSILPCGSTEGRFVNRKEIFCWRTWHYSSNNCSTEIASDTGRIVVPSNGLIETIPGKMFTVPMNISDDLNHTLNNDSVFTASTLNLDVAQVAPEFRFVAREAVIMTGKENVTIQLKLNSPEDREWQVNVQVKLQNCPPGYKLSSRNNPQAECICSGDYANRVRCVNNPSFDAKLQNGYWMGYSPDSGNELVVSLCTNGYCYSEPTHGFFQLPHTADELDSYICGKRNRTGKLCGQCKDGYGPAVNSETFECVHCNETNINANVMYYILSVYPPLFLFFTAIIVFNIRLTTGPANAFILYSQVIASTFYLDADGHIPLNTISSHPRRLLKGYQVPYGVFNLEFFGKFISPLCLGVNLNSLDLLQLDYIVAMFPLFMIAIVVIFVRLRDLIEGVQWKCLRRAHGSPLPSLPCKWKGGQALVHAFAAFVLLSYTKFSLTSSFIVDYQHLFNEHGAHVGVTRSFFAGQYATNDTGYRVSYLLPACIFFTTFVAIPPLLLLEYPVKLLERLTNKVHCLRRFYPAGKVHIFLDTFQGCYKNNMRWFAGLYFIFRLAINLSYIVCKGWLAQYTVQQTVCIISILLVAACQPYRNKILNYVDLFIFGNLALLNSLSFFLYAYVQENPDRDLPLYPFILQYILIFLPMLYMFIYVIWYLSKPSHTKIRHRTQVLLLKCGFRWCGQERRRGESLESPVQDQPVPTSELVLPEPGDEIEALLERAEEENVYRPMREHTNACSEGKLEDSELQTFPRRDYGSTTSSKDTTSTRNIATVVTHTL